MDTLVDKTHEFYLRLLDKSHEMLTAGNIDEVNSLSESLSFIAAGYSNLIASRAEVKSRGDGEEWK